MKEKKKQKKSAARELLRSLPRVDALLADSSVQLLCEKFGRGVVTDAIRSTLDSLRNVLFKDSVKDPQRLIQPAAIIACVEKVLLHKSQVRLRRVINATGVILHTNLGRSIFPKFAREKIKEVLDGYCLLEIDEETAERTHRERNAAALVCELTGAEAATVVNNNAAATMIILTALAKDREVITSRGEMIEIGGQFRIPDVMAQSGAHLVEVGTTNKTYLADYERAITPLTAMLMKVHTSNYRVVGFSETPSIGEIAALGKRKNLVVYHDLGSGALIDLSRYGYPDEPVVRRSIEQGADIVSFSADKLIGGPQAGIVAGRKELVDKVRRNPLFRAFRPGKLTLCGLEATLMVYRDAEKAVREVPCLKMLTEHVDNVAARARAILEGLAFDGFKLEVVNDTAETGGGAMPAIPIPSAAIKITGRLSPQELAKRFRSYEPPVFGKIHDDAFHLDARTIQDEEVTIVRNAIQKILA